MAAVVAGACTGTDTDTAASATSSTVSRSEISGDTSTDAGIASDDTSRSPGTTAEAVVATGQDASEVVSPTATGPDPFVTDSSYLFDQARFHTFDIRMADADLASLDADPSAEEYVEAALWFEGREIGPIGVRYKGSIGAWVGCLSGRNVFEPSGEKTCTKLSMKLRINWDGSDTEFFGQRRLQLHSQNLDPTHMRERLGYWLFAEMGVPAPRSTHARVLVNGDDLGVFALTEQIDGRLTRRAFADGTGNLYKEVWPTTAFGTVAGEDELRASLRTNEDDDAPVDLIRDFGQAVLDGAGDPAALRAVIAERADAEELLAYAVVDRAIRHDDGPFHWYCGLGCSPHNFYWYEQPATGTVHLIPWDLDNAFQNIVRDAGPVTPVADAWGEITADCQEFPYGPLSLTQRSAACDPVFQAIFAHDDLRRDLTRAFLDGPFSEASTDARLDTWVEQIGPAVIEADAAHPDAITVAEWRRAVDDLRRALDHSRDLMRAMLAESEP